MKCGRTNKLLYLNDGELSAAEKTEVDIHLSHCSQCREEKERIIKCGIIVERLRNSTSMPIDETAFADSVMEAVNNLPERKKVYSFSLFLDHVSVFFMNSAVRAAAVSIILLLITTFLFQQYLLLSNVSELEGKLALVKENSLTEASIGLSEVKIARLASDLYNLAGGDKMYADLPRGLILADKSKLNELLSLYSILQQYKGALPSELEAKYPGLSEILEGELSIEKLQEFAKKNKNIIKEFSRLNPAGGK